MPYQTGTIFDLIKFQSSSICEFGKASHQNTTQHTSYTVLQIDLNVCRAHSLPHSIIIYSHTAHLRLPLRNVHKWNIISIDLYDTTHKKRKIRKEIYKKRNDIKKFIIIVCTYIIPYQTRTQSPQVTTFRVQMRDDEVIRYDTIWG